MAAQGLGDCPLPASPVHRLLQGQSRTPQAVACREGQVFLSQLSRRVRSLNVPASRSDWTSSNLIEMPMTNTNPRILPLLPLTSNSYPLKGQHFRYFFGTPLFLYILHPLLSLSSLPQ